MSITYQSSATIQSAGPTIDYGTMSYGSGCIRVVVAISEFGSATAVTSATVGGTSATQISGAARTAANGLSDIWEVAASGSSGDVQVTYNGNPISYGPGSAVALYCLVTTNPTGTGANGFLNFGAGSTISQNIAVPAGGAGIAVVESGSGAQTYTWTNATQDASSSDGFAAFAHTTTTGTVNVSATMSTPPSTLVLSLASWGPDDPTLTPVTLLSNNASTTLAKAGDVVTLTFTANTALHAPTVSILGHATTTALNTSGNTWAASTTVLQSDPQGSAAFLINAPNSAQTATTTASAVTTGGVAVDTLAPTITVQGGSTSIVQNTTYTDQVTATDAHDGTVAVVTSGSVNTATPGSYTLTYTATDAAGNSAAASRVVTVTSSGGGSVVGLIGTVGTLEGAGYTPPRPQLIYPDGHVVYLDATNTAPSIASVPKEIATPTTSSSAEGQAPPATSSSLPYLQNRQLWDAGEDIIRLQQYLNTHGFPIASTGLGSPGHEISTFGPKTFHALKLFQQAHQITPTGYLGPLTRATLSNNP